MVVSPAIKLDLYEPRGGYLSLLRIWVSSWVLMVRPEKILIRYGNARYSHGRDNANWHMPEAAEVACSFHGVLDHGIPTKELRALPTVSLAKFFSSLVASLLTFPSAFALLDVFGINKFRILKFRT